MVETVTGEVEQAFLDAPRSALVALVEDPMGHFEFEDLLCAHQYVMEHSLYLWIGNQNHDRGVAPSREQISVRALSFIPAQAPDEVRVRLPHMLTGAPRKQRKWLARFRNRWLGLLFYVPEKMFQWPLGGRRLPGMFKAFWWILFSGRQISK